MANSEAEVVAGLARLADGLTIVPELAVPIARNADGNLESLAAFLPAPVRIVENALLKSVTSFTDYINRHKSDASVVTADEDAVRFGFIADYHGKDGKAAWKGHTGALTLQKTTAMKNWQAAANRKMNQTDFALFIEENSADINDPSAAVMMQIATEMKAHKKVDFDSKVNLDNGSFVFAYKEDVAGSFQNGQQKVPADFTLAITPFKGMPQAYKVAAKLRYKIDAGSLILWFSIPALDRLFEQAFAEVKEQIAKAVELPVFDGSI